MRKEDQLPLPNAKMKIKYKDGKSELTFESKVDRVNYTMEELVRAANRDVGKFLTRLIRAEVRSINNFTRKARYVPQRYQYWARKQENDLQIGVENTSKGAETAWWADQAELGSNGQPKREFIYNTTKNNIDKIREIQAQYLSAINDELEAERKVAESEQIPDTPDEMEEE